MDKPFIEAALEMAELCAGCEKFSFSNCGCCPTAKKHTPEPGCAESLYKYGVDLSRTALGCDTED